MIFRVKQIFLIGIAAVFLAACQPPAGVDNNTTVSTNLSNSPVTTASPSPAASPAANPRAEANLPVTLPVLDAMFADENFATELRTKLNLTDEQVERLRAVSREAVANLNESNDAEGSTTAATKRAQEQIRAVIGEEKTTQLAALVRERWQNGSNETATANAEQQPNSVPTDTRIVVNAPAYRMDLFKDGQLVRSYKIGIGYPEFPLPTGMRKAETIIFNPTWTPPDEPWVKGKVQPGKKIEAGSALNPLGPLKIPIGLPSLIHGGKNPARLGGFASHGCVGLTDAQVQEVALELAQLTGTQLTAEDVKNYEKNKTETKNVKLSQPLPVELRYDTIVVTNDGKLHIYRDVYERGTNTEENVRNVLQTFGVSYDSLSQQERAQISAALQQMARDPQGNPVEPTQAKGNNNSNKDGSVTRTIKGTKEATIDIAALKGKGYPAPVNLNTGAPGKPLNTKSEQPANANNAGQPKRF